MCFYLCDIYYQEDIEIGKHNDCLSKYWISIIHFIALQLAHVIQGLLDEGANRQK
jgi:hypothetical protein